MGQGSDAPAAPAFPCLVSVQKKPGEGGREAAAASTNQCANWAGRAEHSLCDYTALHCSPCLRPALQEQTKTPTEMREKNTAFAAGKLLCVLLASVLISELHVICTVIMLCLSWLETGVPLLWLWHLLRGRYSLQHSSECDLFCLLGTGTWSSIVEYRGSWHESFWGSTGWELYCHTWVDSWKRKFRASVMCGWNSERLPGLRWGWLGSEDWFLETIIASVWRGKVQKKQWDCYELYWYQASKWCSEPLWVLTPFSDPQEFWKAAGVSRGCLFTPACKPS